MWFHFALKFQVIIFLRLCSSVSSGSNLNDALLTLNFSFNSST